MEKFHELGNPWDGHSAYAGANNYSRGRTSSNGKLHIEALMEETIDHGEPFMTREQHFCATFDTLTSNSARTSTDRDGFGTSLSFFEPPISSYARSSGSTRSNSPHKSIPDEPYYEQDQDSRPAVAPSKPQAHFSSSDGSVQENHTSPIDTGHAFKESKYSQDSSSSTAPSQKDFPWRPYQRLPTPDNETQAYYVAKINKLIDEHNARGSLPKATDQASNASGEAVSVPHRNNKSPYEEEESAYLKVYFSSPHPKESHSVSPSSTGLEDEDRHYASQSRSPSRGYATDSSASFQGNHPPGPTVNQRSGLVNQTNAKTSSISSSEQNERSAQWAANSSPVNLRPQSPISESILDMVAPLRPKRHGGSFDMHNHHLKNVNKHLPPIPEPEDSYYETYTGLPPRNNPPSLYSQNTASLDHQASPAHSRPERYIQSTVLPTSHAPITVASVSWDPSRPMASPEDPTRTIYPAVLHLQVPSSSAPGSVLGHGSASVLQVQPTPSTPRDAPLRRHPSRETLMAYARAMEDMNDLERIGDEAKTRHPDLKPAYPKNWTSTLRKRPVPWIPKGLRRGPRPTSSVYSTYSGKSMVFYEKDSSDEAEADDLDEYGRMSGTPEQTARFALDFHEDGRQQKTTSQLSKTHSKDYKCESQTLRRTPSWRSPSQGSSGFDQRRHGIDERVRHTTAAPASHAPFPYHSLSAFSRDPLEPESEPRVPYAWYAGGSIMPPDRELQAQRSMFDIKAAATKRCNDLNRTFIGRTSEKAKSHCLRLRKSFAHLGR